MKLESSPRLGFLGAARALLVLSLTSVVVGLPYASRTAYEDAGYEVSYEFFHHNHSSLTDLMHRYAARFPGITRLYSIGRSVRGAELWAIEITDRPGVHESGEPEFSYVANMHGNEVTGRETVLYLMQYLCEQYAVNATVKELVDSTRIHLLPTMNPDGYSEAFEGDGGGTIGRYNANFYDLNRNFPDRFHGTRFPLQPETLAIIKWLELYPFVLSANLHNGALVAIYPFDNSASGWSVYTASPDDDIFQQLAKSYSFAHPTMHLGEPCAGELDGFKGGITNGAAWYNVNGGMQDYHYLNASCFQLTIEQGCYKYPYASALEDVWNDNKGAMISYIYQIHRGVAGFATDTNGTPISNAEIVVSDREHSVRTTVYGEYWRLLASGHYSISAHAEDYSPDCASSVRVPNTGRIGLNFTLKRSSESEENSVPFTCCGLAVKQSLLLVCTWAVGVLLASGWQTLLL